MKILKDIIVQSYYTHRSHWNYRTCCEVFRIKKVNQFESLAHKIEIKRVTRLSSILNYIFLNHQYISVNF